MYSFLSIGKGDASHILSFSLIIWDDCIIFCVGRIIDPSLEEVVIR